MKTHELWAARVRVPAMTMALMLGACDEAADVPADTTLRISAYGEEFVEEGIPAQELVDGWRIDFDRFLVAISEVESDGVELPGSFVVDLSRASGGEGHTLGEVLVPAVDHPHLSFTVAPPQQATAVSADAPDVQQLVDEGQSMWVEGRATRADVTLRFFWGFDTATRYEECHGVAELATDEEPRSQLTLHADHLFYDDLDSEEPNVAFDLIASADTDGDGEITPAELAAVDITTEARYQVGSREITDLWGFIEAQTRTVGHIDGEGHCESAQ